MRKTPKGLLKLWNGGCIQFTTTQLQTMHTLFEVPPPCRIREILSSLAWPRENASVLFSFCSFIVWAGASQLDRCQGASWGLCEDAHSSLVGLGGAWGSASPTTFQVALLLLVQWLHFEQERQGLCTFRSFVFHVLVSLKSVEWKVSKWLSICIQWSVPCIRAFKLYSNCKEFSLYICNCSEIRHTIQRFLKSTTSVSQFLYSYAHTAGRVPVL